MAPAMSSRPVDALEWKGEGVTIAQVLDALTEFRRKFAQAQSTDDDHPRPRNSVMTLIAVAATEAEEKLAQRICTAIAVHHPSLAIVVRDQANVQPGRIDASITAPPTVHVTEATAAGTASPAHYELVTLQVRGPAATHLAGLVDPLLVSGVPTYIWWLGTPPFGSKELRDALDIADALVVDSAGVARPYHSFLSLADTSAHAHRRLGLADLQWARLDPWRESIAQFFAPEARRPFLSGISEIGIDYAGAGRGNRIPSATLIGWISSALGWKLQRAAAGGGGTVVMHFAAEGWRPVQVALRSVPKDHLAQGEISAVRIAGAAGGKTFQLTVLRDPDRPRRPAPDIGACSIRSPRCLLLHAPAVKETLVGGVLPDVGGVALFIGILRMTFLHRRIANRVGVGGFRSLAALVPLGDGWHMTGHFCTPLRLNVLIIVAPVASATLISINSLATEARQLCDRAANSRPGGAFTHE